MRFLAVKEDVIVWSIQWLVCRRYVNVDLNYSKDKSTVETVGFCMRTTFEEKGYTVKSSDRSMNTVVWKAHTIIHTDYFLKKR